MKCNDFQEQYPAYEENAVKEQLREKMGAHLNSCPECSSFVRKYHSSAEVLHGALKARLPEGYFSRLNRRLEKERKPAPAQTARKFFLIPAYGFLFISAGIGLFIYISNNTGVQFTVPQAKSTIKNNTPLSKQNSSFEEIRNTAQMIKPNAGLILRGAGDKTIYRKIIKQWQNTESGLNKNEQVLITTEQEWNELLSRLANSLKSMMASQKIDFENNAVIGIFMGRQNNGSHVTITGIEERDNYINVEYTETLNKSREPSKPDSTPYHIVVIPKD